MVTRQRLILATSTCLAFLTLWGLWMLASDAGSGVTQANVERLTKGMWLEDVKEVFGREGVPFHGYIDRSGYCWENSDRSYAIVLIDNKMKVVEAYWHESPESIGEKIGRWLHWPWWK